ncbi:MAG: acetoacetate--CoA ligase [Acidimicrobiales bacterium]
MTGAARGEIVWEPDASSAAASRMVAFGDHVGRSLGRRFAPDAAGYDDLLSWTLDDPSAFWTSFADWIGVRWHDRPTAALGRGPMPGARWFEGGTLSYAEHALFPVGVGDDAPAGDAVAIVSRSQTRPTLELTWDQLRDAVARCRAGLAARGVGRGDRVAAYLPNVHETIVAFLATASLGAVWSSCAPEFGVRAVIDRWSQLEPTVLFAIDGYRYGSRDIDRRDELAEIVSSLPSLQHVVRLPYLDHEPRPHDDATAPLATWTSWDDCLATPGPLAFEAVPADHPLYVLFSSGTTGLPKPIVHGHGGIVVEHLKVHALHHDLRPGDRFMWFTTTGWMMWNYLVSGLAVGTTLVLFDGDPAWPDLGTLWRIAADERLQVFGVSAPFVMACRKAGLEPGATVDLSSLRQLGSTGAPLPADGFRWIRDRVGTRVQPCSVSGGTDVCTAFVGAAPTVPVRAGEISVRMLGCDVRAVDPDGGDCPPGVTGELVIAQPLPSMPVGLWGDPTGERYRATYFEAFPGRWHHGDWITFHDDGACEITGRSDATLNRGGVRLGTSDFYGVVEAMPEVADSVVVHLEDDQGGPGTLILLVACAPGSELDDELRRRIATTLRRELSPRHVPDVVDVVRAIPRTLSGKKLEVPIKRLLLGQPAERVASRGSLADPTALDDVVAWAEARRASDRSHGTEGS